jgi:hypothetical protein
LGGADVRPVGQAVVCLVNIVLIRMFLRLPVPSPGIFLGAMVAASLDLDMTDRPPHSTPYGHSVLFVGLWNIIGLTIAFFLKPYFDLVDIGFGLTIGLWGHLLLDVMTGVTVFTFPKRISLFKATKMAPASSDFERLHDGGSAIVALWDNYQRLTNGELAWPYWGRFSFTNAKPFRKKKFINYNRL